MTERYAVGPDGRAYALSEQQALETANTPGVTPITKENYAEQRKAAVASDYVDKNWGTAGKAAVGFGSGLTLGLGPSLAARMGVLDKDNLEAAEQSGAFMAGDAAGMIAPAVLSGGESLAARGLAQGGARGLGKVALALSPAGLMGEAGGLAERFAGKMIGEAGIMGRLANSSVSMAARGATEGAINNMAHTVADEVIQNKPLAAQAILASGMNGALFGGLTGGVMGGATAALGAGIDVVGGRVAGFGGGGATRDFARVMEHAGASDSQVANLATRESGVMERAAGRESGAIGATRDLSDVLNKGEGSLKAGPASVYKASSEAAQGYEAGIKSALKDMSTDAPAAVPVQQRLSQRLADDFAAKFQGVESIKSKGVLRDLDELIAGKEVRAAAPVAPNAPASNVPKTASEWGDYRVALAKHELALAKYEATAATREGGLKTWQEFAGLRDSLASHPNNPYYKAALNVVDDEMVGPASALMTSHPELAKAYASNVVGKGMAEEFQAISKVAAHNPPGNPLNVGQAVGKGAWAMLVGANPLVAPAMIAGSQLMNKAKQAIAGPMAEAAMRNLLGGAAVKATVDMGQKMTNGVRGFLRGTAAGVRGEHATSYTKPSYTMDNYQKSLKLVDDLTSAAHQAKVKETTDLLAQQGHPEMAKEMAETYGRAVAYMQAIRPKKGLDAHQKGSLGKLPKAMAPDTKGMKTIRALHSMTQPLDAIMGGLERGDLSRDAVAAFQYVYPAAAQDLNMRVAQELVEYRNEGKYVPADKLAQLGTLLNSVVDSKLDKSFVDATQAGLAANKAPPPDQNSPPPPQTDVSSYMTPTQQAMS